MPTKATTKKLHDRDIDAQLDDLPSMRVIVVSHDPAFRNMLSALAVEQLKADDVRTSTDLDGLASIEAVADLLLLDLPPSVEPDAWLRAAEGVRADRRILATAHRNLALAQVAYNRGFHALLERNRNDSLSIAILRLVLAGGEYFPCFGEVVDPNTYSAKVALNRLTRRQREVLLHLRSGQTNKEIAKSLGISIATVKLHVQSILAATGARNRTEAITRF